MNAELLVALFNYDSMKRREIMADMEDLSEQITLVDTSVFTPSPFPDCEPDGELLIGWEGARS